MCLEKEPLLVIFGHNYWIDMAGKCVECWGIAIVWELTVPFSLEGLLLLRQLCWPHGYKWTWPGPMELLGPMRAPQPPRQSAAERNQHSASPGHQPLGRLVASTTCSEAKPMDEPSHELLWKTSIWKLQICRSISVILLKHLDVYPLLPWHRLYSSTLK